MHQVLHDISDGVRELSTNLKQATPAAPSPPPGDQGDTKLLVTVAELATMTGLSKSSIYQLRYTRDGPVPTKVGGRLLFHRDDVAAWLETQREPADESDRIRPWRESWTPGRIGQGHPRSSEPVKAPWCRGSGTEPMAASRYAGRAVCRDCRDDVLVNKDGRLRKHHPRGW
jgi:excisionase family DNA binding protein